MLLRGLTWLVAFQLLGTVLNVLFLPMLPGPIIGMVLLFAGCWRAAGPASRCNWRRAVCCAIYRSCWCRQRWG